MRVGLVSDTHGTLPPRVLELFEGVDLILHAGDVGAEDLLVDLGAVARVVAVSGNCDRGLLAARLRAVEHVQTPAGLLMLTHVPPDLDAPRHAAPKALGAPRLVVFGHTHFPKVMADGAVTYVNPGSASRGRGAPPTVAIATLEAGVAPRVEFFNAETGEGYPASQSARHAHDTG